MSVNTIFCIKHFGDTIRLYGDIEVCSVFAVFHNHTLGCDGGEVSIVTPVVS